jgi:hypothetical protein
MVRICTNPYLQHESTFPTKLSARLNNACKEVNILSPQQRAALPPLQVTAPVPGDEGKIGKYQHDLIQYRLSSQGRIKRPPVPTSLQFPWVAWLSPSETPLPARPGHAGPIPSSSTSEGECGRCWRISVETYAIGGGWHAHREFSPYGTGHRTVSPVHGRARRSGFQAGPR